MANSSEFSMQDFFPTYPDVDDKKFREKIYSKYEFRELIEKKNKKIYRDLFPHQEILRRFMMPFTGYNSVLVYHEVGTGKTAIAVNIGATYINTHKRCIILMKGDAIKLPFNYEITKIFGKKPHYFSTENYTSFGNKIEKMTDEQIHDEFDNCIFIIDEVHHLRTTDERSSDKKTYNNIWRLLHIVRGCKKIIMTGTPMVDNGSEIASIMNLILDADNQMSSEDVKNHLNEDGESYFKKYFNGRISYVRRKIESIGNIIYNGEEVEIKGETRNIKLKTKLVLHEMSEHQANVYYEKDISSGEGGDTTFALAARHALNFAPPRREDKKTGKIYRDIDDYLEVDKNTFNFKFIEKELRDIKTMRKYSAKYADIISEVKTSDECTFIYLPYIPSGIYPMAICFKAQGYTYYDGSTVYDIKKGKRKAFSIITSDISLDALKNILNIFNSEENKYGEYLQVVFGSKRSSEAIGFVNVRRVDIVQPDWNSASIIQALGRPTRPNSLKTFSKSERYIKVNLHASITRDEDGDVEFTKDIELYLRSEEKQEEIERVENYMKKYAFDAYLNMHRNNIDFKFKELPIDYSTYLEYFGNEILTDIKSQIINMFNLRFNIPLTEIIDTLGDKYNTKLIIRSIDLILDENLIVVSRFGIKCYVRKYNDVLYLQPMSSIGLSRSDYLNSIYSNFFFSQPKDITTFATHIISESEEFKDIYESENLTYDILKLDVSKRAILLEDALTKDIPRKDEIKEILKNVYFVFNDGVIINTARKEPRILDVGKDEWKTIKDKKKNKYFLMIKKKLLEREEEFPPDYYAVFTCDSNNFRLKDKENISKIGSVCVNIKPSEILNHIMNMQFEYEYPDISKKDFKKYLKNKDEEWGDSEEDAKKYYYWFRYESKKSVLCDELLQITIDSNLLFIR